MIEQNNTCTCYNSDWYNITTNETNYCVYCGSDKYLYNP